MFSSITSESLNLSDLSVYLVFLKNGSSILKVLPYLFSLEKNHDLVIVSKDVFMFSPDPPRTIFPSCQATLLNWMRINHARDLHDKYDQSSQPKTQIPPIKQTKKKHLSFFSAGISLLRTGYFFQWNFVDQKVKVDIYTFAYSHFGSKNHPIDTFIFEGVSLQKNSRGMSLQWRVKDHHRRVVKFSWGLGKEMVQTVEESSEKKLIPNSVSGITGKFVPVSWENFLFGE